jgi:hypothetical protein
MKERAKNMLNFKKRSLVIIAAAVALAAVLIVGFAVNRADETSEKWDRRPMIMVDGQIYMDTGKQMAIEIDDSAILGTITSSVDGTEKPAKNGESNFGCEGAQYAFYDGGLVVMLQNEWVFFAREMKRGDKAPVSEIDFAGIQAKRLTQHLLDFAEIPRGEDLRAQEYSGDWDGDGKADRAYFSEEPTQAAGYNYRNRVVAELGNGERIIADSDELEQMSSWGGSFLIESADLTGDGQNEILLLIDLGGQGGRGSFGLYPYVRMGSGWMLMDAPHHGFPLALDYKDGRATVTSGDYSETVACDALLTAHYAASDNKYEREQVKGKDYHEEYAADSICDIALKQESGRTVVKVSQYVAGITGVHVDGLGYLVTTLSWSANGRYSVDDMYFVFMP